MSDGRWGDGAPGSHSYFSHAVGPPNPPRAQLSSESMEEWIRLRDLGEEAAKHGPVITAMERWLEGEPVPSFDEQLATFGLKYADHLYAFWRGRRLTMGDLDETTGLSAERWEFIRRFCFAVPTKEALDTMEAHQPLLEIGAGSGAWARLLSLRGVDIIATDSMSHDYGHGHGTLFPVERLQGKTAVRRYPERNVFCAWPTLSHTWPRQAVRAMRPGRYLFVVREDATADERTWDYVEEAFESHADLDMIGWHFLHDRFQAWRKLGPKQRRMRAEKAGRDED